MPVSPTSVQTSPSQDPDIWQSLGVNYRPSMLIDFERGRPAELEMTIGSVLDHARWTGTDTPRLDLLYGIMKIKQHTALIAERARLENLQEAVSTPMLETSTFHSEKVRGKPVFSSAFGGKDASWPSLLL